MIFQEAPSNCNVIITMSNVHIAMSPSVNSFGFELTDACDEPCEAVRSVVVEVFTISEITVVVVVEMSIFLLLSYFACSFTSVSKKMTPVKSTVYPLAKSHQICYASAISEASGRGPPHGHPRPARHIRSAARLTRILYAKARFEQHNHLWCPAAPDAFFDPTGALTKLAFSVTWCIFK